ncbi:MAG: YeeE/YedE family protein [Myxococcota bacterium]
MTEPSSLTILLGGLAFGTAAGFLLLLNGRIAGFSGIFRGVILYGGRDDTWKAFFLAGAIAAGGVASRVFPGAVPGHYDASLGLLVVAGLLVGIGTRLGNGCTSGHGVCGIGRLSKRSFVATLVFVGSGIVTVAAANAFGGTQ